MASQGTKKKKKTIVIRVVALACVSCALAGCIGIGFASAGMGASSDITSFGLGLDSSSSKAEPQISDTLALGVSGANANDSTVLTTSASRDISQGIAEIEAEELAEEQARIAAAEEAKAIQEAEAAQESAASAIAALEDVDWTVGKDAFIDEWTARIDAYLAGSPLAGQGAIFAEAAWENGVDPRWSPAISNTESTKGANCFASYNAWGWMDSTVSWSNWEDAINAHVAGLATYYGYSITLAAAQKYCPPTYTDWFNKTIAQMMLI